MSASGQSDRLSYAMSNSSILLRPARGLPAYLHHLLRISTVQVCRESGYRQSSHAALDTLTSLLQHLIRELGLTARHYAELSGRADVNLIDLLNALDDYQYDITTLLDYHTHSDQLPFPRTLPNFPTPRPVTRIEPVVGGLEEGGGGMRRAAHIPPYLPRWPEERTYKRSEVRTSSELTNADKRHKRMEQNRAVEQALMRIQQAERQTGTDGTEATAASKRLKVEEAREGTERRLGDPSTHQPTPAPPPPFPHRERERERTIAKNPYLAPLAPPQPPPPAETDGGSETSAFNNSAAQSGWSEAADVDMNDMFGSNPPPPRSSGAGGGSSRSQPAAPPPPVADDAEIEI